MIDKIKKLIEANKPALISAAKRLGRVLLAGLLIIGLMAARCYFEKGYVDIQIYKDVLLTILTGLIVGLDKYLRFQN
jgi:hypothetical protein